ncbi:uncharacterized protein [Pyrus communis]|uniref:uncharacterized protein n=1 Tax=Pyrus communis TaxID=23211 RepID=UPI0035C0E305
MNGVKQGALWLQQQVKQRVVQWTKVPYRCMPAENLVRLLLVILLVLIGHVSDIHLWGTLEMFTLVSAYGLFFEGDQRPGSCWSFCGKIAVCQLRHWPIDLYFIY